MTFLPIVARELRVAARRRGTYFGRVAAAFVPIVIAGFWLPVLAAQFSTGQGRMLFTVLSTLTFGYCLLAGARTTADCVSAEKREGTIGLLFLTDLKGYDVILGKLVSRSLAGFYALVGIVPVLALALLLGGVTLDEVGRTALLLVNTLFFSTAVGVFVSTLSRHDRKAVFATVCVIAVIAAAPYLVAWAYAFAPALASGGAPRPFEEVANVLKPSPVFAFQVLHTSVIAPGVIRAFYDSILITHIAAWVLLGAASLIVPHVCRERPSGRLSLRWLTFRNRWSYGAPAQRAAFRARLLDRNAFYWLAARDRIKAQYVWIFVAALGLIWCWAGWVLQSFIFDWDMSFWLLFLLYVFLKVWLTSEVCTRLAEDRASSAFELLLSSPLSIREMARGQTLALWRQFGRPALLVLFLSWLLLRSALKASHYGLAEGEVRVLFWSLNCMLVADMITLQWVGMWLAVTRSPANKAIVATSARVLLLPTVLFLVCQSLVTLYRHVVQPANNDEVAWGYGRACLTWLAIGLTIDLLFGWHARWRFLHQFRAAAALQYAPPAGIEPFLIWLRRLRARLWPSPTVAAAVPIGKWSWRKWLVGAPLLAMVLGLVVLAFWRHAVHQRLENKLAEIKRSGAPITLSELQSWAIGPTTEGNAAALLQSANFRMNVPAVVSKIKTAPRVKLEWPGPVAQISPEFKEALAQIRQTNQPGLDLLRRAAKLQRSRFSMSWQNMPATAVPWQTLAPLYWARNVLEFDALLAMEEGRTSDALETIETLVGVSRGLEQEPHLAGQHYRQLLLKGATRILERLLNQQSLATNDIERLIGLFHSAELATGPAFSRAVIGQRCLEIDEFRSSGQGQVWPGMAPTGPQKALMDFVGYAAETSGYKELRLLRVLENMDEVVRRAGLLGSPEAHAPLLGPVSAEERRFAPGGYWEEMLKQQGDLVALLRVAQGALAIERFRTEHQGQAPQNLAELAPMFLKQIPADPFVPSPLRYCREEPGYLIYSVGRDGVDDGGEAPRSEYSPLNKAGFDLPFRVKR